jgi:1-acyl-sn-glycerol-3-phosphate acyltransferase
MAPSGRPYGSEKISLPVRGARYLRDLAATLLLWGYFTAGFVIFFSPFYLLALLFPENRPAAFQTLNSRFYRLFFALCRLVAPKQHWDIAPDIRSIKGAIILCNHVSYLDSILLISLFPRHTTIAKARLFRIPVLGRLLALSGYIPSSSEGRFSDLFMQSLDRMAGHLEKGGNIIIFPEGSRSRDGAVGTLHKGIFKIARYCRAPITLLGVRNTDRLFKPGKFLFDTCSENTIHLRKIAQFHPDYTHRDFSIGGLMTHVRGLLEQYAATGEAP